MNSGAWLGKREFIWGRWLLILRECVSEGARGGSVCCGVMGWVLAGCCLWYWAGGCLVLDVESRIGGGAGR